jgi:hypothetical protein
MAAAHLARYPLFGLLSRGQLDEWLAAGQEAAYAPGETIFQENSPGAWVYLVRAGRVRLLRRSGPREITIGTLLPGDASASTPFCVLAEISRPAALLPPRGRCACRWHRYGVASRS